MQIESSPTPQNPLIGLTALGQSVWLDYIRRDLYQGPELRRLIEEDGLRGMTSNPTIFQKAIADTQLYDDDIRRLVLHGARSEAIVEDLAVEDVRCAADAFRPVHEATEGNDGFVSIEVRPQLAHDIEGTMAEARRLWSRCNRPNVMVKIPATDEGIIAIHRCLYEGINVNITLLFSVSRYREVMEAYLDAMEMRAAGGHRVGHVRSVASFFVSRVDSYVDQRLDAIAQAASSSERERQLARGLRGKAAIANARVAYQLFENAFAGPRFARLRRKGVELQRPLWASTSTKDPSYPDLYYVEALIAPNSVNTMPPETLGAYRDHGDPRIRIHDDLRDAHSVFQSLAELGILEQQVTRELEEDGARRFADSIGKILAAVTDKESSIHATR